MFRASEHAAVEACRPALVVLDFDGTLTDADAHADPFHAASRDELARRLGIDAAVLEPAWRREYAAIAAAPPAIAWEMGGYGVCPAAADPYIVANGVAKALLAARHPEWSDAERLAAVLEVHHDAYQRVPPPFRPDARSSVEALCAAGPRVAVVTNSHTQTVERLLDRELTGRGRDALLVRGNANKFFVGDASSSDPRYAALAEALALPASVPGPGRPVLLRRGRYFDVLSALWRDTGATPATTLVVGDNFELDLALPAALGAHVHLVMRRSSPAHEPRLARALARGDVSATLGAVLERLAGGGAGATAKTGAETNAEAPRG